MFKFPEWDKAFTQGYYCAVAALYNNHGEETYCLELLQAIDTNIDTLKQLGVDQSDIDTLMPLLAKINKETPNE